MISVRRPSRLLVWWAVGWLGVVVLGSGLVWAVISRAGEGVGDPAPTSAAFASEPTGPAAPTSSATPSSHHTAGSGSSSPEPTGVTPTGSAATAEPGRRTWQGTGGTVVAECSGTSIRLIGAQADSGFHLDVDDRGPVQVKVAFEASPEQGSEASSVRGVSSDGVPVFTEVRDE